MTTASAACVTPEALSAGAAPVWRRHVLVASLFNQSPILARAVAVIFLFFLLPLSNIDCFLRGQFDGLFGLNMQSAFCLEMLASKKKSLDNVIIRKLNKAKNNSLRKPYLKMELDGVEKHRQYGHGIDAYLKKEENVKDDGSGRPLYVQLFLQLSPLPKVPNVHEEDAGDFAWRNLDLFDYRQVVQRIICRKSGEGNTYKDAVKLDAKTRAHAERMLSFGIDCNQLCDVSSGYNLCY